VQKSDHRHRRLLRTCQAFAPPNVQAASAALSAGHDRPPGGSWQVPPRRAATRRGAYAIDLAALAAVIGERVRDKIAASKRKGLWVGGPVPLGYAAVDKKILVVPAEAAAVRTILPVIDRRGIRSKPRRRSIGRFRTEYSALPFPTQLFLGLQRSPRPERSDQGAPDQLAKIAHRERVSADSRRPVSRFGFAVGTGARRAQRPSVRADSYATAPEAPFESEGLVSKT
jgi:hypothetical protein